MTGETLEAEMRDLETGPVHQFRDWPIPEVPRVAVGVYTIWEEGHLIYVGMAGRGMEAGWSDADDDSAPPKGLRARLNSHASGRRSGDQFCVYVCDRLVVPTLILAQQQALAEGKLSLDRLTRDLIRERFAFRFVTADDSAAAFALERRVQRGELRAGRPLLNPA